MSFQKLKSLVEMEDLATAQSYNFAFVGAPSYLNLSIDGLKSTNNYTWIFWQVAMIRFLSCLFRGLITKDIFHLMN